MKPLDSLFAIRLTGRPGAAPPDHRRPRGTQRRLHAAHDVRARRSWSGPPARIETVRTQIAISALNALAVQMGGLNNLRKTLLVVTEGLERAAAPPRAGVPGDGRVGSSARRIARTCRSTRSIRGRRPPDGALEPERDAVACRRARDTARTDERADRAPRAVDDLAAAIRAAAADASAYYMLTYRSAHEEDGAFHPVQVRVKRARRAGARPRAATGRRRPTIGWARSCWRDANRPAGRSSPLEPARRSSPLIRPWFGLSLRRRRQDARDVRLGAVAGGAGRPGARDGGAARVDGSWRRRRRPVPGAGAADRARDGGGAGERARHARSSTTAPGRLRLRMKIQDGERAAGRFRRARHHRSRSARQGGDRHP